MREAMIPTPFKSNHASNIMPLNNGDLLCAWFGGSREGSPDIYILISRLKKGATEWTEPEIISEDPTRSEQNPVIFVDPDERIWLFYTAQLGTDQSTSVVRYRISTDKGYSWSEVKTIFNKPGSFIRQPLIVTDSFEWLFPMYYSIRSKDSPWFGMDYSVVKISPDQGRSWKEYEVPFSTGLVHMNVVKLKDGRLKGFFRSRKADRIYASTSADNGRTWFRPLPTELPNNNASMQATVLNNGHLAIVFNNINADRYPVRSSVPPWIDANDAVGSSKDKESLAVWGVPRAPLTIAISEDEGETWPYKRDLETDASKLPEGDNEGKSKGEFSYPSIKQTPDGKIHITYTYLRHAIKYVCITEDWIGGE